MRTISIPAYLLNDDELETLHGRALEIMTELAGESETSELPVLINMLRKEMEARKAPVVLEGESVEDIIERHRKK